MTSALDRRTLLRGSAAAVAASVVVPSRAERPDPVVALKAEHDRVWEEQAAAEEEVDRVLFGLPENVRGKACVQLPAYEADGVFMTPEPWPITGETEIMALVGRERAAPLIALWRADRDRREAAKEAAGLPALRAKAQALADRGGALLDELVETPAATAAGLAAQMELVREHVALTRYGAIVDAAIDQLREMAAGGGA